MAVSASPWHSGRRAFERPGQRRGLRVRAAAHSEHCNGTPVASAAQQIAGGDSTRRLHLGSLRSSSVRLAGAAPQLNAVRRRDSARYIASGCKIHRRNCRFTSVATQTIVAVTLRSKLWVNPTLGGGANRRAATPVKPIFKPRKFLVDADLLAEWGRLQRGSSSTDGLPRSAGVKGAARREGYVQGALEVRAGRGSRPRTGPWGLVQAEFGEVHGTCEAANHGGGTGPHFWVSMKEKRAGD